MDLPRTADASEKRTREEEEADEQIFMAAYARVRTCLKAIREKHKKRRGIQSSMPCPVGCGGTLSYSISGYNGHAHGACSTGGCAQWMQ